MKQVRMSVFETNSSSTHSICICNEEDFIKWENCEVVYDGDEKFIPLESLSQEIRDAISSEGVFSGRIDNYRVSYYTYDYFMNHTELSTFESTYTTKSGDEVVAFGRYGYDG